MDNNQENQEQVNISTEKLSDLNKTQLVEILLKLEKIFCELDAIREEYKPFLQAEGEITIEDKKSVKKLLEKYSRI